MSDFDSLLEELTKHLDASRQNWLLGAGISFEGNIPLMHPLTDRVKTIISDAGHAKDNAILKSVIAELDETAHVEHYLSHLGDLIAIADRAKSKSATVDNSTYTREELRNLHTSLVEAIGETVRYGYKKQGADEQVGTSENPIVEIGPHVNFVQALFRSRANLEPRSNITFFTTNYDTLLEDALALEKKVVVDGFSGGAVAFWNAGLELGGHAPGRAQYLLYKLHGSVDWHRDEARGLLRTRYGTRYLSNPSDIMIYPQATKYVETQKDPFATLFSGLRSALNTSQDNVLVVCGYSFMDEHINAEIEAALRSDSNKTCVLAFAKENPSGDIKINQTLDKWLKNSSFGKRIFVAGEKGIYNDSVEPVLEGTGTALDWWTFAGLTEFLKTGEVK